MTFDATAAKDYLTISEIAAEWRVTSQHVSQLIRRGALPAIRIGRRIIVPRDAAQKFLERNATARAAA